MGKTSTILVFMGWEGSIRIQVSKSGLEFNQRSVKLLRKPHFILVLYVAKGVEGKEHGSMKNVI